MRLFFLPYQSWRFDNLAGRKSADNDSATGRQSGDTQKKNLKVSQ